MTSSNTESLRSRQDEARDLLLGVLACSSGTGPTKTFLPIVHFKPIILELVRLPEPLKDRHGDLVSELILISGQELPNLGMVRLYLTTQSDVAQFRCEVALQGARAWPAERPDTLHVSPVASRRVSEPMNGSALVVLGDWRDVVSMSKSMQA